jgi:hypothetical protein
VVADVRHVSTNQICLGKKQRKKNILCHSEAALLFANFVHKSKCPCSLMSDKSNEGLEETQKNQKKIGAAESNPKTTGPAEKLREDAAKSVDEDEEAAEPV